MSAAITDQNKGPNPAAKAHPPIIHPSILMSCKKGTPNSD